MMLLIKGSGCDGNETKHGAGTSSPPPRVPAGSNQKVDWGTRIQIGEYNGFLDNFKAR